jgi:hypothetical protein
MRTKILLFVAALILAILGIPEIGPGFLGVTSAEADGQFYTRKRINGRWVTGKWPRGSDQRKGASSLTTRSAAQVVTREAIVQKAAAVIPAPAAMPPKQAETPPSHDLLQKSVEARAKQMAAALGSATPRSVTFDFETGVKTVVFSHGVVKEEPFDPESMRFLVGPTKVSLDQ